MRYHNWKEVPFDTLKDMTLTDVVVKMPDEIIFTTLGGQKFGMIHEQECCESVEIDDICGDFKDLLGEPLLVAEETSNSSDSPKYDGDKDEYWTWTFYKLRTRKGDVTIRWYGASNGYYSESVSFFRIPKDEDEND